MEILHENFLIIVELSTLFLNCIAVILIIFTALRAIYDLISKGKIREHWMSTFVMALSFLLMGEALHTLTINSLSNLVTLAGIFILRALMVFLMHWEMKSEK